MRRCRRSRRTKPEGLRALQQPTKQNKAPGPPSHCRSVRRSRGSCTARPITARSVQFLRYGAARCVANTSDRAWRLHAPGFTKNFSRLRLRHTRDRDIHRVRTESSVDFVCDRFDIDAAIVLRRVQAMAAVGIACEPRAIAAQGHFDASSHRSFRASAHGPMPAADKRLAIVAVGQRRHIAWPRDSSRRQSAIVGVLSQNGRHRRGRGDTPRYPPVKFQTLTNGEKLIAGIARLVGARTA